MNKSLTYIDSTLMVKVLTAAIARLFRRREYIDRINVFPVPDGDTGTNMAFSFKVIHEAVRNTDGLSNEAVDETCGRRFTRRLQG